MPRFGTNGIREVVGETLTPAFARTFASAVAATAPPSSPEHPILVGRDGRTSSEALSAIVRSVLTLAGHFVVDSGVLPTPAHQYLLPRWGAVFGVVVTASHNPPEFNGFKCFGADGLEATPAVEGAIETAMERAVDPSAPFDRIGASTARDDGARTYSDGIERSVAADEIRRRRFTVVLDCGNGASVVSSPYLLRRLGCRVVTLNGHLDGTFPGHLSEPTEANLVDLARAVPALGADLGIAHDGDADRAVFIDRTGQYVPGEKLLALLAREAVIARKGGVVVTPVTTSSIVEEAVAANGGSVVYTRVGSPSVCREMRDRRAVFGGEENGGLIFPTFQLARDGLRSAAGVLELLARTGRDLGELVRELPERALVKEKVACPATLRERVISELEATFGRGSDRVVTLDGVKAYFGATWVLVRPSGTEPLVRVFAEAHDRSTAQSLANRAVAAVKETVERLASRSTAPTGDGRHSA